MGSPIELYTDPSMLALHRHTGALLSGSCTADTVLPSYAMLSYGCAAADWIGLIYCTLILILRPTTIRRMVYAFS